MLCTREAGARFINLDVSVLTDKWYGESQKIAGAVFTLATKIQPCIIFIDEIGKTTVSVNIYFPSKVRVIFQCC